jgi:hypothetical protein
VSNITQTVVQLNNLSSNYIPFEILDDPEESSSIHDGTRDIPGLPEQSVDHSCFAIQHLTLGAHSHPDQIGQLARPQLCWDGRMFFKTSGDQM